MVDILDTPAHNAGSYHIATRVVQSQPDPTGAVVPPIYLSSTFHQEAFGEFGDFAYQRSNNPTRQAAETALATIEEARFAVAYTTGMAAVFSVLSWLKPGQALVLSDVYGGTHGLVTEFLAKRGIDVRFFRDLNTATAEDLPKNLGAIFLESPTNPQLRVIDIERTARLAHQAGAQLFVDNTFSTAYLQRPLELGADAVVYSATKYLGGHSDMLAGVVLTNDPAVHDHLKLIQKEAGNPLSPFDSYSLIRGVKTLAVRLDRASENATAIRRFLEGHPNVARVLYPGWFSPQEAAIQERQSEGLGAVLGFELAPGADPAVFAQNLRLIRYAVSLGSVETLVSHPATMTHEDLPAEERAQAGISDQMFRLSVGIENVSDLIEDLSRALNAL